MPAESSHNKSWRIGWRRLLDFAEAGFSATSGSLECNNGRLSLVSMWQSYEYSPSASHCHVPVLVCCAFCIEIWWNLPSKERKRGLPVSCLKVDSAKGARIKHDKTTLRRKWWNENETNSDADKKLNNYMCKGRPAKITSTFLVPQLRTMPRTLFSKHR